MKINRLTTGTLFALATIGAALSAPCSAQEPPRFVESPADGGLLDTQTGLVWGFGLPQTGTYLGEGTTYTWAGALGMHVQHYDENGNQLPEPVTYQGFSNWYWPTVRGVADWQNHDDWRIPTRDEMTAAATAGLTTYLDASPEEGFQPWIGVLVWSSTEEKHRGVIRAYAVNLTTGGASLAGKGSPLYAIAVRGVAAPVEGGSGNGKGKNK